MNPLNKIAPRSIASLSAKIHELCVPGAVAWSASTLALLDVVLNRLRLEYTASDREAFFLVLKETLSGGRSEIPYRDLGRQLDLSEGAIKVAAHRLRKRYRELLREEIANTVSDPADVEDELRNLFTALGG